jgi:hypothetical protein
MDAAPAVAAIRADLASAYVRFEETARVDAGVHFEGSLFAGPALVGPPGRVHGGLHPILRLLEPLERLTGRRGSGEGPIALDLLLRRALPLETPIPFEGRLELDEGFRLFTRFDGTERLDATARSVEPEKATIDAEPWRAALCEHLAQSDVTTFLARGTVPVHFGRRLASMKLDEAFFAPPDQELARYRRVDGTLDDAFMTVALDFIGACAAGFTWRSPLFTSRLELILVREPPKDAGPLYALADLERMGPRADSTLPGAEINGVLRAETDVPVLLATEGLEQVFAHGVVAVYPAKTR